MAVNTDQKIKFMNSYRENFLMMPQSSDKTWKYLPQIASSEDKKKVFSPPASPYYYS